MIYSGSAAPGAQAVTAAAGTALQQAGEQTDPGTVGKKLETVYRDGAFSLPFFLLTR